MRTLVAGLGNVFEGDDGFGVAVAAALAEQPLPDGVEVRDFGIRGVHLAYQLLDGYDLVVLVDLVARGGEPGALYVIEHAPDPRCAPLPADAPVLDAHDLAPDGVLALVPMLGGALCPVVVVGCEPASLAPGMALTPAVAGSVEKAALLVVEVIERAQRVSVGSTLPTSEVPIGGGRS